jgi:hypothetical protein
MNDLSEEDRDTISLGHCPHCKYRGFVIGPWGGMSINIECGNVACRRRYNVAFFSGRALAAQEIGDGFSSPAWVNLPAFGDHVTGGNENGEI